MSWKPGRSWPSQAQITYLAALITVVGALFYAFRWLSDGRSRRASWPR